MQDNFAYLLPFIMLTFGVVFLFLQRIGHASARFWGFGYLSAAFGFAAPLVLGFEVQAIVSNLLFFSAFFFSTAMRCSSISSGRFIQRRGCRSWLRRFCWSRSTSSSCWI